MSADFDPYYKWLGIPPEEQPPNYYRLLGLPVFEQDGDVIQNAVDQRMAHIRTFQGGKNAEISQIILNELSAARVNLLAPDRRAQYDEKLRVQLTPAQPAPAPLAPQAALPPAGQLPPGAAVPPVAPIPAQAAPVIPVEPAVNVVRPRAYRARKRQKQWLPLVLSVCAVVILAGVLGAVYSLGGFRGETPEISTGPEQNPPDTDTDPPDKDPSNIVENEISNRIPVGDPPRYALQFDGRDYVIFESSDGLANWSDPFTIEMWFRIPNSKSETAILGAWGRQQQAARSPAGWGISISSASQQTAEVAIRYVNERRKGDHFRSKIDARQLADWCHLAVCGDGNSLTLWFNGGLLSKFEKAALTPADALLISLGSDPRQLGGGISAGEVRGFRVSRKSLYSEPFAPARQFAKESDAVFVLDFSQPLPRRIQHSTGGASELHGVRWVGVDGRTVANDWPRIADSSDAWNATSGGLSVKKSGPTWIYELNQASGRVSTTQLLEVERTHRYIELASATDSRRYRVWHDRLQNWSVREADWVDEAEGKWGPATSPTETIVSNDPPENVPPDENPEVAEIGDGFAIPTLDEQQAAKEKIKSLLGDQFLAATDAEAKAKLASELLKIAGKDAEKTPVRYVLFQQARGLAEEAGRLSFALAIVDQMSDLFPDVDAWKLKAQSLNTAKTAARGTARRQFAEEALVFVDQALDHGQFELADEAVKLAYAAAGADLRRAANDKRKFVAELKPEWDAAKPANQRLETDPENPAANKVWGIFLCLVQRNWDAGLKHLAKADDQALRTAAETDIAMPRKVDDQIALADAWWDLAESYKDRKRDSLKLRSRTWYERASAFATAPLSKQKIEKRMAATAALAGSSADPAAQARGVPRDLRAEYFGMVGGWLVNPRGISERGLQAMPGLMRYKSGHTISESQVEAMVRQVTQSSSTYRRVRVALQGKVYAKVKTEVTLRHTGGGSSYVNATVLVDGVAVSAIGNDYEIRTQEIKLPLKKGEHNITWVLNGEYADVGGRGKLEVVDAEGQPLTIYHSKEMLRGLGVRDVRVPGIHLGS